VDAGEARLRFAAGRVARLATVDAAGQPMVLPIVFAVEGDTILSIVDAKPKASPRLKRLANIAANPRVSLVVDHYDEDWDAIWWARADGTATVAAGGPERDRTIAMLRAKYPQYAIWGSAFGDAVVVRVDRWLGWSLR
jgi:PPOX class probable F420-dependent enzyme